MLLVVLGAATLTFFVLRLAAGDPARLVNPPGTPEEIVTQVRERLGTDEPLLDRVILVYVAVAQSTPNFWLAVVLVLVFAVELQWLPAIDKAGPESFVLPVTTLVVMLTPVLIRTVRQSFLETLGEDHVRAARARGLSERRVLLVHGLKVASLPLVTLLGLQAGFVLAGAYVVEFIFNWPGIGKLTLDAINSRNFPMIQGGVLAASVSFVLVNFVVDLVYGALDPRIRHG